MKIRPVWLAYGTILILLSRCQTSSVTPSPEGVSSAPLAKNVVLMIGDGMALNQVSAAMLSSEKPLSLEQFPVVGLQKTSCLDDLITDSGAGATAFACGIKTLKFAVGVNKDTMPCRTILEEARNRGLATGLVVTSTLVHATPAAFASHQPLRAYYDAIASDMFQAQVDFMIGGGRKYFEQRTDKVNLVQKMRDLGYDIFDYREIPLEEIEVDIRRKFVYFTSDNDPLSVMLGRTYLPYASELACTFLRARKPKDGFFLMIEGSQIDWAGHSKDTEMVVAETLDFDRAIGRVLKWAQRRGDTLVIVTGDHETGGLTITADSKFGDVKLAYATNDHTPVLVPVYAFGPGAERFAGIYENTQIYHKMRQALGWE